MGVGSASREQDVFISVEGFPSGGNTELKSWDVWAFQTVAWLHFFFGAGACVKLTAEAVDASAKCQHRAALRRGHVSILKWVFSRSLAAPGGCKH